MAKSKDPIVESLNSLIKIRQERQGVYNGIENRRAEVITGLFGGYPEITNDLDLNRYGIYMKMVEKMIRYANNFYDGGHDDSLDDIAIFSQMLKEMDKKLGE